MNKVIKTIKSKKAGSAIVLAMFAVVILFITGLGLLRIGLSSRIYAIRTAEEIKARCAADAGLAKALFEMNQKLKVKPWNDSLLPSAANEQLVNCDAFFSYNVIENAAGGYTILTTGNAGQAQEAVRSSLKLQGPFEFAIFADESISLDNSATIDWYNYTDDDSPLQVGTNNTQNDKVVIKNNGTINGDVLVGPGGNPDEVIDNKGTIAGDTDSITVPNELSSVTLAASLQSMSSGGTIENSTTLTGSGKYSEINLQNGQTITIDGHVSLYVTGDVTLDNSAEIKVVDTNPNACLTLYIGGDFEGKNGSVLNNLTMDPKKLKVLGLDSCQKMVFKNDSDLYSTIYAPAAQVTFDNSADAYGAVVAESFEQKNSATFYYDASLREPHIDEDMIHFAVGHWSED